MSDHIPDATKMVCPFCDAEPKPEWAESSTPWFSCGTMVLRYDIGREDQTEQCANAERKRLILELTTLRNANAALVDQVKALKAVVEDPHALWANWLRGTVNLPSGIGDIRQSEVKATQ